MTFKANGNPCDHFREHMLLNSGSFSTVANTDADLWRETAIDSGLPSRKTHQADQTAYPTPNPAQDSWGSRLRGWVNARYNNAAFLAGNLT